MQIKDNWPGYDEAMALPFGLDGGNPDDARLAHELAFLTVNWGRVEYHLYMLLLSIDETKTEEWTRKFFGRTNLEERTRRVREEIIAIVRDADPAFAAVVDQVFGHFKSIRDRRNILVHGVWLRRTPIEFEVRPLRTIKGSMDMALPIQVDRSFVAKLNHDIRNLFGSFSMIAMDVMLHQFNEKIAARRAAAKSTEV